MKDRVPGNPPAAIAGVISTWAGVLAALLLMPDDPLAKGALMPSGIALSLGLVFVPLVRAMRGAATMFNAENFVAIGIAYWIVLDLIQGAYPLYETSESAVRQALTCIGVFGSMMWVGTWARPWRAPEALGNAVSRSLPTATLVKMLLIAFGLGMARFVTAVDFDIIEMLSYLGQDRWSAPWGRGQLGGWDAFIDHTQYFGYVVPALATLIVLRRGWLKPDSVLAIVLAIVMVLFLSQGGGRRIIGVTVGAAIIVWVLVRSGSGMFTLLGAAVAVAGLLAGMQFVLEIRSQGYAELIESGAGYDYLHVDDNFLRLAQMGELIPAEHPFVYFRQIFFILIRPIPRVFWEGKPIDAGFDLPAALGLEGVSLSSSIVGEWYLAFGLAGVAFGGWFHGRLASATNLLHSREAGDMSAVIYAIAVMVLVSGVRSMLDLVLMSYAILAWVAIAWAVVMRSRRTAAA